jgi:hypothetical protein
MVLTLRAAEKRRMPSVAVGWYSPGLQDDTGFRKNPSKHLQKGSGNTRPIESSKVSTTGVVAP